MRTGSNENHPVEELSNNSAILNLEVVLLPVIRSSNIRASPREERGKGKETGNSLGMCLRWRTNSSNLEGRGKKRTGRVLHSFARGAHWREQAGRCSAWLRPAGLVGADLGSPRQRNPHIFFSSVAAGFIYDQATQHPGGQGEYFAGAPSLARLRFQALGVHFCDASFG